MLVQCGHKVKQFGKIMYSFNKTKFENNPGAFKLNWKCPVLPYTENASHYLSLEVLETVLTSFAFSPCVWRLGVRLRDNFLFAKLCVLDVDEGMTVDEAIEKFKKHKLIVAASRNHLKIKDGKFAHRFRIVMEFDDFITERERYEHNMQYYTSHYGTDIKTKDAARFYFPCTEILYSGEGFKGQEFLPALSYPYNEKRERAEKREREIDKIVNSKKPSPFMQDFDQSGAYTEGCRNDRVYKQAQHMTLKGFDLPAIIEYCQGKTNLKEREVSVTCTSAYNTFARYKKT